MADDKFEDFVDEDSSGDDFSFDAIGESDTFGENAEFGNPGDEDQGFSLGENDDQAFSDVEFPSDDENSAFTSEDVASDMNFDDLPSPDDFGASAEEGDPDAEFNDFESGGDFSSEEAVIDPYEDNEFSNEEAADLTEDVYATDEDEDVDPFNDPDDFDPDEDYDLGEAEPRSSSSNVFKYGLVAAVIAGVGYVGYTQILPMFLSTGNTPVVAQNEPEPMEQSFPTSLPEIANTPVEVATPSVVVTNNQIPKMPLGNNNQSPQVLEPIDLGSGIEPVIGQPTPMVTAPVVQAFDAPTAEIDSPTLLPMDEIVGGPRPGGLDAMRNNTVQTSSDDLKMFSDKIDDVISRLAMLENKVSDLEASFDNQVSVSFEPSNMAPVITEEGAGMNFGVVTSYPESASLSTGINPPLKPSIIENVVLRGVSGDTGWLGINGEVVKVAVGDVIENASNAGIVESYQNYQGRWIAVTNTGIILPK